MASKFLLHEINKLSAEVKPGSLAVLLISFANQTEIDLTEGRRVFPSKTGYCLMGKSPVDFVHFSKENSPDISLGEKAWLMSTVSLRSCCMKLSCSDGKKFVSFKFQPNSVEEGQVPVDITAQELWAKDIPLLDLNSTHNPLQVLRPRTGKVVYIYKYYDNKLQRTEVKEDYTCPICTLNHASFMGIKRHLPASHDLFNYEFLDEGGHQLVAISVPTSSSETFGEKLHTGERKFFFCRRPTRRMGSTIQNRNANRGLHNPTAGNASDVIFPVPEPAPALASGLGIPRTTRPRSARKRRSSATCITSFQMSVGSEPLEWDLIYRPTAAGESSAAAAADAVDGIFSVQEPPSTSAPGPSARSTTDLRSARSRRHSARNVSRLEGRVFVHSHTAQPMSLAEVYAEADSEDEVDKEVAAIEDKRNLNHRFGGATEPEKRMMHLWNVFKNNQRVLADAHMPWACEAFCIHHKEEFDQSPEFVVSWNAFMSLLKGYGLLDTNTMDKCRFILNS